MDFAQFIIDLLLFLTYTFALILLLTWCFRFWKMFVHSKYNNGLDWIMLEIKLPREINKNPIAMEIALNSFLQSGGIGTTYAREIQGKLPIYFSLEIASLEGTVHFYIRTERKFKSFIEANFYSQYPGIEITEADDYTQKIRYEHLKQNQNSFWGVRYKTAATWNPYPEEKEKNGNPKYKMPADFKPIKTFVDFGLDKDPKEEFKNDPITPLIEFLGSMGKGEYAWYQILVQDSEGIFDTKKFPKTYVDPKTHEHMNLGDMAKKRKEQIRKVLKAKKGDQVKDENGNPRTKPAEKDKEGNVIKDAEPILYGEDKYDSKGDMQLSQEEKDEIEAINRKLSKPLVRVVIRLIYITKGRSTKMIDRIQGLLGIMRPYSTTTLNKMGLSPSDPYDYPWQNTRKRRTPWRSEEMFNAYVEREGLMPHIGKRDTLDKNEDLFFFPYKTYVRNTWRMFYEAIFHPFDHPHPDDVCTLNLEELASLWHFPGAVAQTPTLPRIDSTKGVAPTNLPTM